MKTDRSKATISHAPIFGQTKFNKRAAYCYMALTFIFGLFLGSSPIFSDLVHGFFQDTTSNGTPSFRKGGGIHFSTYHQSGPFATNNGSDRMQSMHSNHNYYSNHATIAGKNGHIPSLLFMIPTYTMNQFSSLQHVMDSMKDICNSGWNVTVHIQSSSGFGYDHERYPEVRDRLYCSFLEQYIPLYIEQYEQIGFGLNSRHRVFLKEHVHEFDYVSFAEEDMLLTVSHLRAFQDFQAQFKAALPQTWIRYTIGFLRYEDSTIDTERVSWEYMPKLIHAVDMGPILGKYIVTNNLNQAIYLFSQEQLLDLEQRCGFLTDIGQNAFYRELRRAMNKEWKYMAAGVSEWSSSFQQILQCGMRRVVPAGRIQDWMIHHTVDKAQKRRLRKELMNARDWKALVQSKFQQGAISIEEAYNNHVYNQYNLGLIEQDRFKGKSIWSWGVASEEARVD